VATSYFNGVRMASVKRNLFFNLLLVVSNIAYPLVVFPYVSRVLGPSGIGESQFVLSFAKYFTLIAAIGIPIYGVREVAKVAANKELLTKLFSELLVLGAIASAVFSVVYALLVLAMPDFRHLQLLCWIAGLQIVLAFTSVDWLFYGKESFKNLATRSIGIKLGTVALVFLLVKTPNDIVPYMLVSVLSLLMLQCWNMYTAIQKTGLVYSGLNLKRHLPSLTVIFLTGICTSMYTAFDTTLLGLLDSVQEVGFYATSVRIAKMLIPIVSAISIVIIPKVVHEFGKEGANYAFHQKSFSFILELSVPLMFGLYLLAHEWVVLLAGSNFEPAVATLQILSPITLLVGLNNLFGMQVLSASGNERTLLYIVAIAMVLSVLLNVWLIPTLHHTGAAIALLATEAFVTLATFIAAHQKYRITFPWRSLAWSIISSLPFMLVVWVFRFAELSVFSYTLSVVLFCLLSYGSVQLFVFRNESWIQLKETFKSYLGK